MTVKDEPDMLTQLEHIADPKLRVYVQALHDLYPAHPAFHSVITRIQGTTKHAPQKRRPADLKAYLRHLSAESLSGVGGLGQYPGELVSLDPDYPDGKTWMTRYVVLDFDAIKPDALRPFVETLEGYGLYCYLTTGTTGRGAHVYLHF